MSKKIIFSTGGTGGHIFPALSIAKHFEEQKSSIAIITDLKGYNFIKDSFKQMFKLFLNKKISCSRARCRQIWADFDSAPKCVWRVCGMLFRN